MDEAGPLRIDLVNKEHLLKTGLSPSEASLFVTSCNPSCPKHGSRALRGSGNASPRSFCHPSILFLSTGSCTTPRTASGIPPHLAHRWAGFQPRNLHGKQIWGAFWSGRAMSYLGRSIVVPQKASRNSSAGPSNTLSNIFHLCGMSRVVFHQQPQCFLDTSNKADPGGVWVPGAHLNVAECCLATKGSKTDSSIAIVYRNEGEDDLPLGTITPSQFRANVSRVANALEALGFKKGDAIAIDMPINVHAVTAYLAIILAGCVVVSISDSFVAHEIAVRIRLSQLKAISTQDVIRRGGKRLPLYRFPFRSSRRSF